MEVQVFHLKLNIQIQEAAGGVYFYNKVKSCTQNKMKCFYYCGGKACTSVLKLMVLLKVEHW